MTWHQCKIDHVYRSLLMSRPSSVSSVIVALNRFKERIDQMLFLEQCLAFYFDVFEEDISSPGRWSDRQLK